MKKCLVMLLSCLMLLSSARAETVLRGPQYIPEAFKAAHPEVTVIRGSYMSGETLLNRLITRSLDQDVFRMDSDDIDIADVIDKGFCLDLSGNEAIRDAVSRMHPAISGMVMRDGAIYGVPYDAYFGYAMVCDEAVWTELGYTAADVPKTFPALLDFLESWIIRQETNNLNVCVKNSWDNDLYNGHTYAHWLVSMLLDSWINQQTYAGQPMNFSDPELVALLERAKRVGENIYRYCEPSKSSSGGIGVALFQDLMLRSGNSWAELDDWMVDPRITADQPTIIPGSLDVMAVYAGTAEPEMAAELALSALAQLEVDAAIDDNGMGFLFADAEPMPNLRQQSNIRHWRNLIALAEHRLAGDSTPITEYLELTDEDYVSEKTYEDASRMTDYIHTAAEMADMLDWEVQDWLDRWQGYLAESLDNAWSFSPEALAAYKAFARTMRFPTEAAFRSGNDNLTNYESLINQYVEGVLSAGQLASQLDRIAQMVELENR